MCTHNKSITPHPQYPISDKANIACAMAGGCLLPPQCSPLARDPRMNHVRGAKMHSPLADKMRVRGRFNTRRYLWGKHSWDCECSAAGQPDDDAGRVFSHHLTYEFCGWHPSRRRAEVEGRAVLSYQMTNRIPDVLRCYRGIVCGEYWHKDSASQTTFRASTSVFVQTRYAKRHFIRNTAGKTGWQSHCGSCSLTKRNGHKVNYRNLTNTNNWASDAVLQDKEELIMQIQGLPQPDLTTSS